MDYQNAKPEIAQVLLQVLYAGLNILVRYSVLHGMDSFVYLTYRQSIAAIAVAPVAYISERKKRTQLTTGLFCQIFLLALCGLTLNQNFYLKGISYTGSTFSAAMANLLPAFAFVLAALLGMEEMEIRTIRGKAKVVGTVSCVGGAMTMTFYSGPAIQILKAGTENRLLGSALLLSSVICWSTWLTVQSWVVKRYPAHLTMTCIMCLCGAVQSAAIALVVEQVPIDAWALAWDMQLLTYLYAGLLCSGVGIVLQSWSLEQRGPVFVAIFSPLCTVLVAIMEICILHYTLHVGSVIGAVVIIVGLYLVLWGKNKGQSSCVVGESCFSENQQNKTAVQETIAEGDSCVKVALSEPLLQEKPTLTARETQTLIVHVITGSSQNRISN